MSSYDITFCVDKTCKLRSNCKRNTDRISKDYKYPVSMAAFAPNEDGSCDYYEPISTAKCDLYGKGCAACSGCAENDANETPDSETVFSE